MFVQPHPPTRITRRLLAWYDRTARDFPWRRTRDPYEVFVSEIMLQQTQADRVAMKMPEFLARFPDVHRLARARRASVIKAWQGMGYNRRAVHLHDAARAIVAQGGTFPRSIEELRALPGIGRYTASAVLCFAFGIRVPVVDVNIRRVLSRVSRRRRAVNDVDDDRVIWDLAERWLPRRRFYEWNQALMELGARVCTARRAACPVCPLNGVCASADAMIAAPRTSPPRAEPTHRGRPHRLWRGSIIDALRDREFAGIAAFGRAIDPGFADGDAAWLRGLIDGLEREGLIRRAKGRIRLG